MRNNLTVTILFTRKWNANYLNRLNRAITRIAPTIRTVAVDSGLCERLPYFVFNYIIRDGYCE